VSQEPKSLEDYQISFYEEVGPIDFTDTDFEDSFREEVPPAEGLEADQVSRLQDDISGFDLPTGEDPLQPPLATDSRENEI
jgi:hypothetical protein